MMRYPSPELTAIISAANEVAVEAFLAGRLAWLGIAEVVEDVLAGGSGPADVLEDVLDADRRARVAAGAAVDRRSES